MATIRFTNHALERLFSRGITPQECQEVYESGEVIEEYPEDYPFPSVLKMKRISGRILHIVASKNGDIVHIITAYYPDPKRWLPDFKGRVK